MSTPTTAPAPIVTPTTTTRRRGALADPDRRSAFAAGVAYLVTFVSSIPAVLLLRPVLYDHDYVLGSGADTRVLLGSLLDIVNALAGVASAVALYPVLRRLHPTRSLAFLATRTFEATVIAIGVMCLLAVVTLRRDLGGAGVDDPHLATVARALVSVRDWTFLVGPTLMAGLNAVSLASALHRSRLVPRWIPRLGLVGAPMLVFATLVGFARGNEVIAPLSAVAVAPIFVWELALGLRLAFRGFLPTAPATAA